MTGERSSDSELPPYIGLPINWAGCRTTADRFWTMFNLSEFGGDMVELAECTQIPIKELVDIVENNIPTTNTVYLRHVGNELRYLLGDPYGITWFESLMADRGLVQRANSDETSARLRSGSL